MPLKRSLPQDPGSAKRKKITHSRDAQVEALEKELTASLSDTSASLNRLPDLIALATTSKDPAITHDAIYALYRVFVPIITGGRITAPTEVASDAAVVKAWLKDRLKEYVDFLCVLLYHGEPSLRMASLEIMMGLLKPLSSSLSTTFSQPRLHADHFNKLVHALLVGPPTPSDTTSVAQNEPGYVIEQDVRDLFLEKWLEVHDDIRWFFLREAAAIVKSLKPTTPPLSAARNLLSFLERLTTMPTTQKELNTFWVTELSKKPSSSSQPTREPSGEDEGDPDDWLAYFEEPQAQRAPPKERTGRANKLSTLQSLHSLPSHRVQFSNAWMVLLQHLSSPALASRALSILHKNVLPHFTRPLRLMDWIAGCVDYGGAIGLLALNALFTLMKDYNLDYPNFYTRLYAFLTRDVLHLKYRARFFRLTELFLSSTHLPATLLASFIKRLSRLSLTAPPAAIVMIIPLTYNILKQHPALMSMIHRETDTTESDPFDAEEPNPLTTDAISSSLWELASHREHYLSSVSTMARVLSEAFTKPSYSLEDFLDHTYTTLFETESKRKLRKDPAMGMDYEGQLFPPSTTALGVEAADGSKLGDVVSELWGFGQ